MFFSCDFRLEWMQPTGEPDDFISTYLGDVFVSDEDDADAPRLAAKSRLFIINADAAEKSDWSLVDVLDSKSETAPYIDLINLDEAGNFSPSVCDLLDEEFVFSRNMLILDRISVLPEFRGRRLGLSYIRAAVGRFGMGCRISAIKPFPLQFEGAAPSRVDDEWTRRLDLKALPKGKRAATAKLKRYYGSEGFVPVKGTELMILDLHREDLVNPFDASRYRS